MKGIFYLFFWFSSTALFAVNKTPLDLKLIIDGVKGAYTVELNGFRFLNGKSIALSYFTNSNSPDKIKITKNSNTIDTVAFFIADVNELIIYKEWEVIINQSEYEATIDIPFPFKSIEKQWEKSEIIESLTASDKIELKKIYLNYIAAFSNADSIFQFSNKYLEAKIKFEDAFNDSAGQFGLSVNALELNDYYQSLDINNSVFTPFENLDLFVGESNRRVVNLHNRNKENLMLIKSKKYSDDKVNVLYFIKDKGKWQLF